MKLKYVHQPGFVEDLVFVFSLWFNQDRMLTEGVNPEKKQLDIQHYQTVMEYFGPFPAELLPFFYMKKSLYSFMTQFVYVKQNLLEDNLMEKVYDQLTDTDYMTGKLFAYYYEDQPAYDTLTLPEVTDIVMNAEDPDAFKARVTAFFISPEETLRLLVRTMRDTEKKLKKYYEENYARLLETQAAVGSEQIVYYFQNNREINIEFDQFQEYHYSLCLADKNTVFFTTDASRLFVLGYDYADMMSVVLRSRQMPDLVRFGKVLSEANRKKILDMIMEAGELCTADIAKHFSSSVTVVYYHLEMMAECKMLCCRNVGRTIYYRINPDYFENVRIVLKKYVSEI